MSADSLPLKDIVAPYYITDVSKYGEALSRSFLSSEKLGNYVLKSGRFYFFDIKDCIHYKAIESGDYGLYLIHINLTKQREHSLDKFSKMLGEFNINMLDNPNNKILVEKSKELNKYIIRDGLHRLCIYVYLTKSEEIPLKYLKIL